MALQNIISAEVKITVHPVDLQMEIELICVHNIIMVRACRLVFSVMLLFHTRDVVWGANTCNAEGTCADEHLQFCIVGVRKHNHPPAVMYHRLS